MMESENGKKVVTDPYIDMLGYKLPEIEADIVTTSHDHSDHNNVGAVKGNAEHIHEPGRFSKHGIEIKGVEAYHDKVLGAMKGKNIIFNLNVDGINVCHCGDLGHLFNEYQLAEIGKVDVLILPVGGYASIDASDAVQVMRQLNPAVVIPMHYRTKALGLKGNVFSRVDKFISAAGMEAEEYDELELNKSNINDYSGIAVLKYD